MYICILYISIYRCISIYLYIHYIYRNRDLKGAQTYMCWYTVCENNQTQIRTCGAVPLHCTRCGCSLTDCTNPSSVVSLGSPSSAEFCYWFCRCGTQKERNFCISESPLSLPVIGGIKSLITVDIWGICKSPLPR